MLLFCRRSVCRLIAVRLCVVTNVVFDGSIGGVDALKIEEMEKMLKEAQLEKARLIESRVRRTVTSAAALAADYPESILAER